MKKKLTKRYIRAKELEICVAIEDTRIIGEYLSGVKRVLAEALDTIREMKEQNEN